MLLPVMQVNATCYLNCCNLLGFSNFCSVLSDFAVVSFIPKFSVTVMVSKRHFHGDDGFGLLGPQSKRRLTFKK